jgi:7-carboxy-7-deazaguanine synthase
MTGRSYAVKEIFKTLQGEGHHTGKVAVFCRFSGCNLWSGREEDRPRAVCKFCDTDFVGGERYRDAEALASAIEAEWGTGQRNRFVVLTGGEPLLQVDDALLKALRARRFFIAVESNGTIAPPEKIDWLTVSPKAGAQVLATIPAEIKLIFPQADALTDAFVWDSVHAPPVPAAERTVLDRESNMAGCHRVLPRARNGWLSNADPSRRWASDDRPARHWSTPARRSLNVDLRWQLLTPLTRYRLMLSRPSRGTIENGNNDFARLRAGVD